MPPGWEATETLAEGTLSDCLFQSTPPGWEATRGEWIYHDNVIISIHASRLGGDGRAAAQDLGGEGFQSTPPVWEAT